MYAEELVGGLNIVDDGVGELVFVLPGDVADDGLLWMSYYSSHEGKTSIYLAKIKFK